MSKFRNNCNIFHDSSTINHLGLIFNQERGEIQFNIVKIYSLPFGINSIRSESFPSGRILYVPKVPRSFLINHMGFSSEERIFIEYYSVHAKNYSKNVN